MPRVLGVVGRRPLRGACAEATSSVCGTDADIGDAAVWGYHWRRVWMQVSMASMVRCGTAGSDRSSPAFCS